MLPRRAGKRNDRICSRTQYGKHVRLPSEGTEEILSLRNRTLFTAVCAVQVLSCLVA